MNVDKVTSVAMNNYDGLEGNIEVQDPKVYKDIERIHVEKVEFEGEESIDSFVEKEVMTEEEATKIAKMVNEMLKASYRRLDVSIHQKTNQVMIKVIDTSNDKVIREVPPEKSLDVLANMWELAGILVDTKG